MRSRRKRRNRRIEVVDNKVNLINIKSNKIIRRVEALKYQYDEDMNNVAKGLVISVMFIIFLFVMFMLILIKLYSNGVVL